MKDVTIHKFVGDQLSLWPLACRNFRALKEVSERCLQVGGLTVRLQFNPARMISSAAKLTDADIAARKCFLCRENRPAEQRNLSFAGRKGRKYDVLVNPYPVFPDHLVIAMSGHTSQSIWRRYVDMLDMASACPSYTFFYNGPKCGASAPDHHHFQAVPRGQMPLEEDVDRQFSLQDNVLNLVAVNQDARLYHYGRFTTGVFVVRSKTAKSAAKLFYRLLDCADVREGDDEPRINLFSWCSEGEYRSIVVFRSCHRSHHYFSDGPDHLTMSPGCADMAGVFIVPVREEFETLTSEWLSDMVREVSVSEEEQARIISRIRRGQRQVEVGIMSAEELTFEILNDGAGRRTVVFRDGRMEYDGVLYDELYFEAPNPSTMFAQPSFVLCDVVIGKGFHWERKEDQTFAGALKIVVEGDRLTAVNVVGVEDYLLSVISSEMRSSASEEFLKAHAVISRSWLMRQLMPKEADGEKCCGEDGEIVRWYDRADHDLYDVCADDHCQRYQGLTRAVGSRVRKVVDATWGQVLAFEGEVCDARFSKCCGGIMERFSTCWSDRDYPYLRSLPDTPGHDGGGDVFCDTADEEVLDQVLNNYDRETPDFYRWTVEYGRDELTSLLERRIGMSVGRVSALEPLQRGGSGRISRLRVVGEERTVVVGKELEIRRILSDSHLKSSAFDVEYLDTEGNVVLPQDDWSTIRLSGAGWGHGVGLCQIGAAVMASRGYDYRSILAHYYPGAEVVRQDEEI